MKIKPITFKAANAFVKEHHRHNSTVTGCKFCISCVDDEEIEGLTFFDSKIVGVAICGRPVSRYLDNGETLEINRLCTDGTRNACSMLYSACLRIAKAMGYTKVITYTLESEDGASLKASGFKCEGIAGGTHWTGERGKSEMPNEMKKRWIKEF